MFCLINAICEQESRGSSDFDDVKKIFVADVVFTLALGIIGGLGLAGIIPNLPKGVGIACATLGALEFIFCALVYGLTHRGTEDKDEGQSVQAVGVTD